VSARSVRARPKMSSDGQVEVNQWGASQDVPITLRK
jgi:hypothetical protein